MWTLFRFAATVFLASACATSIAETPDRLLILTHPGMSWMLQAELPDSLEQYNNYKEGAGAYSYGQTLDGKQRYSLVIHRFPGATDASSCRESELAKTLQDPRFGNHKIDRSESAEVAFLQTSGNSQISGRTFFIQHAHAYMFRDGVCAKVHASSTIEGESIRDEIRKIASSIRIVPLQAYIVRTFHVPRNGALKISMLPHWGYQTSAPGTAGGREVNIGVPDGSFRFMATTFISPAGFEDQSGDRIRKMVEAARERLATRATQSSIDLVPVTTRDGHGYYVFVSDRALAGKPPTPGNWKHMRQGILKAGSAIVTFSVFSNEEHSPDALRAMRTIEAMEFDLR